MFTEPSSLIEKDILDVLPAFLQCNEQFARIIEKKVSETIPIPSKRQLDSFLSCVMGFKKSLDPLTLIKDEKEQTRKRKNETEAGDVSEQEDEQEWMEEFDNRWFQKGDPDAPNDNKCIFWNGPSRNVRGKVIPAFYMNGKRYSARMLMYLWFVDVANDEDSTTGKHAVYTICGSDMCVNPAHLTLLHRGYWSMNTQLSKTTTETPFSWNNQTEVSSIPGCSSPWYTPPPSPRPLEPMHYKPPWTLLSDGKKWNSLLNKNRLKKKTKREENQTFHNESPLIQSLSPFLQTKILEQRKNASIYSTKSQASEVYT
jgi:hypothetical protein